MSCYHPLTGVWHGKYTASGAKKYDIVGTTDFRDIPSVYQPVLIPCGKCIGCRLDYSRSWADRMMLELETAEKAIFITLTYDNEHLPVCQYDADTDLPMYGTLDKRDCQLFFKRLRKHFGDIKIRFYLAGEYGENTLRPHYHAIVFGLGLSDFGDLRLHGRNELGQQYYISDTITSIWHNGFVLVSDVSWKTCAYVARYVTKKLNGLWAIDYAIRNCEPEFALMSRKPGIAREYYELHPECLDSGSINISTPEGGLKISAPKYYLKQLKLTDPDSYDKISKQRKEFAEDSMMLQLQKTNLSLVDYLESKEEKKLVEIRALKRSKVR